MGNFFESQEPNISGVMMIEACPKIVSEILNSLDDACSEILKTQLQNLFAPAQRIGGVPEQFSIMTYPLPRLTYEQRQLMELVETQSINVDLGSRKVRIDLDDFGQINWLYVSGIPEMYASIEKFMPHG